MRNCSNHSVFNSKFTEGIPPVEEDPGTTPSLYCPRKLIPSENTFELLHVVLYYLYTNTVCFCTDEGAKPLPGTPKYCDPEEVYAIADEFGLEDLRKKALEFIQDTCDVEHLADRLFGSASVLHEEIRQVYEKFFLQNWDEIKNCQEWPEFFCDQPPSKIQKVALRFFELMKRLPVKVYSS
jgi:hypothetical protein